MSTFWSKKGARGGVMLEEIGREREWSGGRGVCEGNELCHKYYLTGILNINCELIQNLTSSKVVFSLLKYLTTNCYLQNVHIHIKSW